jgi:hypothetical protein
MKERGFTPITREIFAMRRSTWAAASLVSISLALAVIGAPPAGEPGGGEIALRPVKYADLGKTVRSLKGKVVLVDFWAEY